MKKAAGGALAAVAVMLAAIIALAAIITGGEKVRQAAQACGAPGQGSGDVVTVPDLFVPQGTVAGYAGEQLRIAATYMQAAADAGLDRHAQELGVAMAMGESSLTNVEHGDLVGPDSVGTAQQRDWWGPRADRLDPYKAATMFFTGGQDIDGPGIDHVEPGLDDIAGWQTLPPTEAIHRVQRNADPFHYEKHWGPAQEVVAAIAAQIGGAAPAEPVVQPVSQPPSTGSAPVVNSAGPLNPPTQAVADEVWRAFPNLSALYGTRASAIDPSGHPSGNALDLMVPMTPAGRALGDQVAAYLQEHAARLGVDYVIWYQRIWYAGDPPTAWSAMADRGTPTQNHLDHPHVNVSPEGGTGGPAPAGAGAACAPAAGGAVSAAGWLRPTTGPVTSGFGMRWGAMHNGIDIAPPCGTDIYAAGPGPDGDGDGQGDESTVIRAGASSGYGNLIVLDHGGGVLTRYAHMFTADVLVDVGDRVPAGHVIGRVGNAGQSTGCHLHYEVQINGTFTDPAPWMADHGAVL